METIYGLWWFFPYVFMDYKMGWHGPHERICSWYIHLLVAYEDMVPGDSNYPINFNFVLIARFNLSHSSPPPPQSLHIHITYVWYVANCRSVCMGSDCGHFQLHTTFWSLD